MDVFRYINSNAIREHLKEIGYKFSGFEAAWLVRNCRTASLEEKHNAWREILETYPDEEYAALPASYSVRTLHGILKEYVALGRKGTELSQMTEDETKIFSIFGKMEFDFPVPFHTGDILYDPGDTPYYWHRNSTFVYVERTAPLRRSPGYFDVHGVSSGLIGAYQYNDGSLDERFLMRTHNYMSFEYCPEEKLTGVKRIMKALSSLVLGDITEIQFAKAYAYVLADEYADEKFAKKLKPREDDFTDDELRFAGLDGEEVQK